jgi:hypothetical protein
MSVDDASAEDAEVPALDVPLLPFDAQDAVSDSVSDVALIEDTTDGDVLEASVSDASDLGAFSDGLDGGDAFGPLCGDGVVEGAEACDEGEANSDTLADQCRTDCTPPTCGDGVVDSGEDCDDGDLDNTDACTMACVLGLDLPKPKSGEVIFTELMVNPAALQDPGGEWIELMNTTSDVLSLSGCVLRDSGTDSWMLGLGDLVALIEPESFAMLLYLGEASGLPPTATPGSGVFPYQNILLNNTADTVVLECDGVEIDRVAWDSAWPIVEGASMALDPVGHDATSNDDPTLWCPGTIPFEDGDLGSPMALNATCPPFAVDTCRVSSEATASFVGESVEFAVDLMEPGITDVTVGVDESPALVVELGVGPAGSVPDESWSWSLGLPAMGWQNAEGVDRWTRVVSFVELGQHALSARVTLDEGVTWVTCDTSTPPDATYSVDSELLLEVLIDPCEAYVCATPPASECHADAVTYSTTLSPTGACVLDDEGAPTCVYDIEVVDCGLTGEVCVASVGCDADAEMPVAAGQLVMSELMVRPLASVPPTGQWLEITNTSDAPLDLNGCELTVDALLTATVDAPLVVGVAVTRVLGALDVSGANGGVALDWAWGNLLEFPSSAGDVVLTCDDVEIDRVTYGVGWPNVLGASMSLSRFHIDGLDNDLATHWCTGTQLYGAGDLGSPGALNLACPGEVEPIDACYVANASSEDVPAGTPFLAGVWLKESGLTELTTLTDTSPAVRVQAGLAAPGTAVDGEGWTYHDAQAAVLWEMGFIEGPLYYDGYAASFAAPPAGVWQLIFRVSADAGNTWTACDRVDDGSFEGSDATQLTTTPSPCEPTPCEADDDPICLFGSVVLQAGDAVCSLNGDEAECAWPESVLLEDCAAQGATCEEGDCVGFPASPQAYGVVFSELLIIPPGSESDEWFELTLRPDSPVTVVDLSECVVTSDAGESWTVPSDSDGATLLEEGAPMVLARSASGAALGTTADLVYGAALTLDNTSDTLTLSCSGILVDEVSWDVASGWSIPVGSALSLGGNVISATHNDAPGVWCAGIPGSPGLLNPLCPPPDDVLDECRLIAPSFLEVDPGVVFAVAGLLRDEGTTDVSSGVDPVPGLVVETGFGPAGTEPTLPSTGWVWGAAYPDPEWSDDDAPGEDRWEGPLMIQQAGVWDVLLRASADGGATWRLCDQDGASNGYDSAQAGQVTIGAGVCVPNPCDEPPQPVCDGELLTSYAALGGCALVGDPMEAACDYPGESFDCTPYAGCLSGACVSPPATPASAGALIVTEFLRDSLASNPDRGEWVEFYNPGPDDLDLRGCSVNSSEHLIEGLTPVLAPSMDYIVVAQSADPELSEGVLPTVVLPGLTLSNVSGELSLLCPEGIIDDLSYTLGWPGSVGVAAQLRSDALSEPEPSLLNDAQGAWCASEESYGGAGNVGSPGAANGGCASAVD